MKQAATALQYEPLSAMDMLRGAVLALQQAHIDSASLDARLLLQHVLNCSREELLAGQGATLTSEQADYYQSLIAERLRRKPVSRLVGQREFWGKPFVLSDATLDPRPDSETLVASVLERCPDKAACLSVLDFGTGSGCLLLALLDELPQANGLGLDIQPEAISTARRNAELLGLAMRASFRSACWGEGVEGSFDIIVSNPPYIPTRVIDTLADDVRLYDPMRALDGGEDGLDCYRSLLPDIKRLLAPQGLAALEIGAGQESAVAGLAAAAGLKLLSTKKDLSGIIRCLLITHH